tara:strand:+ start:295 stop:405 length:111 start_codon:yes stop_codon:yes gene_type:complete
MDNLVYLREDALQSGVLVEKLLNLRESGGGDEVWEF